MGPYENSEKAIKEYKVRMKDKETELKKYHDDLMQLNPEENLPENYIK
jgi:hypothetical protein